MSQFNLAQDFFPRKAVARRSSKKANELDGATWTKYSISVWRDIKKSPEEFAQKHPAMFPIGLVRRLIRCFSNSEDKRVLDPFLGSGSTVLGAMLEGKVGIGFEIVPEFVKLAQERIAKSRFAFEGGTHPTPTLYCEDSRDLLKFIGPDSVELCITSPPYWDILSQKRTADYKKTRDYGEERNDLAKIHDYWEFIDELGKVFEQVFRALKPGRYCLIDVMDLRKKDKFYPFHSDLASKVKTCGFVFDDMIIWDRQADYNNLRPLGFPSVFRINKVHEYILIFQKPLHPEQKR